MNPSRSIFGRIEAMREAAVRVCTNLAEESDAKDATIARLAAELEAAREALETLESANEVIAGMRTQAQYESMVDARHGSQVNGDFGSTRRCDSLGAPNHWGRRMDRQATFWPTRTCPRLA
jgi:hypothetical protein